jgi:hypothetical protein
VTSASVRVVGPAVPCIQTFRIKREKWTWSLGSNFKTVEAKLGALITAGAPFLLEGEVNTLMREAPSTDSLRVCYFLISWAVFSIAGPVL